MLRCHLHPRHSRCLVLAWLLLMLAGPACADGTNPGYDRPGIGFSPAVLEQGNFTWEQGLPDFSRDHGDTLYSADTLLRLGLGGPLELQLGTSMNRFSTPGHADFGRGDSSVGLKFALPSTSPVRWGLLGNVGFGDGDRRFSSRQRQYLLATTIEVQLNQTASVGAYLETTHSGHRNGQQLAFNAGTDLGGGFAGYVELATRHTNGEGHGSQAGAGLTWAITPRVQLDASVRHRLGGHVDPWQGGIGVSIFFGRL